MPGIWKRRTTPPDGVPRRPELLPLFLNGPLDKIVVEDYQMSHQRLLVSWTVLALVVFVGVAAAGQAPRTVSGASTELNGRLDSDGAAAASKTPWGHPDLRGVWNNSTTTPVERLTDAEQERGRLARAAVRRATDGTGAGWLEQAGALGRESLIIDPSNGRIPAMRPGAIQRLVARENARAGRGEGDSWLDRNSWERCISRTLPVAMIPNIYNANYQIFQTPNHVAIVMEMIHETRIIPLDGRDHVSDGIRQWLGNSRGRWDGDTLVVETTRFHNRLDGGDYQPSHIIQTGHRGPGGTLRLVERFRIADANTIDYQFTVEDPKTFTHPYTVAIPMKRRDTTDPLNHLFEYACHEGNHGMVNLLTGARADEELALHAAALVSQQRIDAGHPGIREPAVPIVPADVAR